jgi:magnesium-transporting ATPase (P-type)
VSGERITDCFALNEADVGFTLFNNGAHGLDSKEIIKEPKPTSDIVRKTSDIVLNDYSLIIDCMQYGRNIFENIRKFVQYQLACAINLVIFVSLGSFIHADSPMSPP